MRNRIRSAFAVCPKGVCPRSFQSEPKDDRNSAQQLPNPTGPDGKGQEMVEDDADDNDSQQGVPNPNDSGGKDTNGRIFHQAISEVDIMFFSTRAD